MVSDRTSGWVTPTPWTPQSSEPFQGGGYDGSPNAEYDWELDLAARQVRRGRRERATGIRRQRTTCDPVEDGVRSALANEAHNQGDTP